MRSRETSFAPSLYRVSTDTLMSGIETKSESETDADVGRPLTQQSKPIVLQDITNNCEVCGKSYSHKLSKHMKNIYGATRRGNIK